MTRFNLWKRAQPEPEPDEVDEEPEETGDDEDDEAPERAHGPIVTGVLGPGQWIAARFGSGVAWGVHAVAVWAIGYYGGWIAAGVILVWLTAVLHFIPEDILDRAAAIIERLDKRQPRPSAGGSDSGPAATRGEAWRAFVVRSIGEHQGVHLRDLLGTLHEKGHHPDWEVPDVRRVCAAAGIPVRNRVRVRGKGVTVGVHRDDLKPLFEPSSRPPLRDTPNP
ncbi:hypothetical protein ACWDA7_44165 [Streptomyces sp. NPDC001156]